jgi:hypothetical protein
VIVEMIVWPQWSVHVICSWDQVLSFPRLLWSATCAPVHCHEPRGTPGLSVSCHFAYNFLMSQRKKFTNTNIRTFRPSRGGAGLVTCHLITHNITYIDHYSHHKTSQTWHNDNCNDKLTLNMTINLIQSSCLDTRFVMLIY